MPTRFGVAAMGSKRPLLINENCEGTGVPTGWTTVSGAPNWDYTTVPLADAQSLYTPCAASSQRSRVDFTDQNEVWIYFLIRLTNGAFSGVGSTMAGLGANGGSIVQGMTITPTNHFAFANAAPTAAVSLDTTYHIWLYYKIGTGANSVGNIGYSTDGVRPTSGTFFAQLANGSGTNTAGRFFVGPTVTTVGVDIIWDNFRIATSQIGDFGI